MKILAKKNIDFSKTIFVDEKKKLRKKLKYSFLLEMSQESISGVSRTF